jgi:hypothetical protein
MLRRLYKRFLLWVLAPVLGPVTKAVTDLQAQAGATECLMMAIQASTADALMEAQSANAKADASLSR